MEFLNLFGRGKKQEASQLEGITVNNVAGAPPQMEPANDNEDPNVAAALASIQEDVGQAAPSPEKAIAGVPTPPSMPTNLEAPDAEDDSGLQAWNASIQNMREEGLVAPAPRTQETIATDTDIETPPTVAQNTPAVTPESIETKKPSKLVGLGPFERSDPPPSQSTFPGAPKMVPPLAATPVVASPSNRLGRMREPSQTAVGEPAVQTLQDRLTRAAEGARTVVPDASPIEPTSSPEEKVSATDIIEDTLATIGGVGATFKHHEEKVPASVEPQAPIASENTNAEIEATEAQAPAVGVPASAFKEVMTSLPREDSASPEATVAAPKHEGEDGAEDIPERTTPFFSAQFTTDIARRLNARGLQDELNSVLNFFEEHYNESMDSFDDVMAIESDGKPDILRDEWFTKELLLHFAIEKYMRSLAAQDKKSDSPSV